MVMKDEIFAIINEEISDLEKERREMAEYIEAVVHHAEPLLEIRNHAYSELTASITALENILQRIDRMDESQMELQFSDSPGPAWGS